MCDQLYGLRDQLCGMCNWFYGMRDQLCGMRDLFCGMRDLFCGIIQPQKCICTNRLRSKSAAGRAGQRHNRP
jgi:hypothetical protein